MAKQIKFEHEKMRSHENELKQIIENLQIPDSLVSQMQTFVDQDRETKQVLSELETLFQKVNLGDREKLMLDPEKDIQRRDQKLAIETFEKILGKVDIFEALKEIETMKETSAKGEETRHKTSTHISDVISAKGEFESKPKAQSQGYFSSFWNLSKYLKPGKVQGE